MPPQKKVVRRRGLQCPFNASQYTSIFLHCLTTGAFVALVATGSLFSEESSSLVVPIVVIFTLLTVIIVIAWIFTSAVDSSLPPSSSFERCFCGAIYCFKRANLKTRYCAVSKKKVPGMDHFCVWMNTAIGTRNYPGFFIVALFSTILYVFQIALSIVSYVQQPSITPIILSSVNMLCSIGVGGLYSYLLAGHIYLIWRQISTFDYLMEKAQQRAQKRKAAKNNTLRVKSESVDTNGEKTGRVEVVTASYMPNDS